MKDKSISTNTWTIKVTLLLSLKLPIVSSQHTVVASDKQRIGKSTVVLNILSTGQYMYCTTVQWLVQWEAFTCTIWGTREATRKRSPNVNNKQNSDKGQTKLNHGTQSWINSVTPHLSVYQVLTNDINKYI